MTEKCIVCFESTNYKIPCNQCINQYACKECIKKIVTQRNSYRCFICGNGTINQRYLNNISLYPLDCDTDDNDGIDENTPISPIPNASSFQTRHPMSGNQQIMRNSNRYSVVTQLRRPNPFIFRDPVEICCSSCFLITLLSVIITVVYGITIFVTMFIFGDKSGRVFEFSTVVIIALIVLLFFFCWVCCTRTQIRRIPNR